MLVLLLAGGAVLLLAGRFLPSSGTPAPDAAPVVSLTGDDAGTGTAGPQRGPVFVHVVGAVLHPGVYRLAAGSRARDAVRRAGGPRPRADLASVNLAALLADGEQVRVPLRVAPGAAATPGAGAPAAIVHLNGASAAELDALDGIGPALAARIVAYRTEHGGFSSVDELDEVSGIGPVRLEALRPRLAL